MAKIIEVAVTNLSLDLRNYRTVPQKNEVEAVHAFITIDPAYFWALTESLIDDGWHGTENVIVLNKHGKKSASFLVKEGNRRIGALKLIHGKISPTNFEIPVDLEEKISKISKAWKTANAVVPCNIFEPEEAAVAERLVRLTHAKGEKAGRLSWNAVARARYNRDETGAHEPALDLLEEYLKSGRNLTLTQKERWGGEYPLSVLAEAIKRLVPRLKVNDSQEAVALYPKDAKFRNAFEGLLIDIGLQTLGFPRMRNVIEDFAVQYGFPAIQTAPASPSNPSSQPSGGGGITPSPSNSSGSPLNSPISSSGGNTNNKPKAVATNDPRSVTRALKKFNPHGHGREKLVRLLIEARSLKLDKTPHAFCFLLRSMFELSAKCYCDDNATSGGPAILKPDGSDRRLVDVLKDIATHMTTGGKNKQMAKELHGATAELAKSEGFLSVTSMNQLVHNKKFSVDETHISTLFHNIFPLVEAMNR